MQKDYRARFLEIAKDGESRTSQEVAQCLGIPASQAIQFLTLFKTDLVLRVSAWRLTKFKGDDHKLRWRLVKR